MGLRIPDEAAAHPSSSAFMTFSQGLRTCIGKVMTVMQFKMIMVRMVSGFDFQLVVEEKEEKEELKFVSPSPMLRLEGGRFEV